MIHLVAHHYSRKTSFRRLPCNYSRSDPNDVHERFVRESLLEKDMVSLAPSKIAIPVVEQYQAAGGDLIPRCCAHS